VRTPGRRCAKDLSRQPGAVVPRTVPPCSTWSRSRSTGVLAEIAQVASDASLMRTVRPVYVWSATKGFVGPDGSAQAGITEPARALDWMARYEGAGVFVMLDLHAHLGDDRRPADPTLVRALRDIALAFQAGADARVLIIVAPLLRIPREIEKDVTLVDFPLPDEQAIRGVLEGIIQSNTSNERIRIEVDEVGRERLAKAALGLTLNEATNAFARAMVNDGVLSNDDVHVISEEKKQAVRKAGLLEFVDVDLDLEDVGGLENLKRWLAKRNNSWLAEASDYGLPAPKGVLMTDIPGCGKSLTAKSVAAAWELPLLRLDVGRVFAGLVGSSEQNMRSAIRTAVGGFPEPAVPLPHGSLRASGASALAVDGSARGQSGGVWRAAPQRLGIRCDARRPSRGLYGTRWARAGSVGVGAVGLGYGAADLPTVATCAR